MDSKLVYTSQSFIKFHLFTVEETHSVQMLEDVVRDVPQLEDDGEAEDVLHNSDLRDSDE